MIDWLNPSDDILDARSIGFAEGQQSRDEEVADLTAERDALAAELDRLRQALAYKPGACRMLSRGDDCDCTLCKQSKEIARLRTLEAAAIHWNTHRCVHGVGRLERAIAEAEREAEKARNA